MKSYTDISQSKKLAKILPKETADFHFRYSSVLEGWCDIPHYRTASHNKDLPCWSLAALLDILESEIDGENGETFILNIEKDGTYWNVWYREEYADADPIEVDPTEELVDACYEMIIKLRNLKLL